jgi:hypothetical protein
MRRVTLAALAATAAFSVAAPAALAQGQNYYPYGGYDQSYDYRYDNSGRYYRSYDYDRRYYNNGVDMRAIRDKCENDWRRAIYKGNTGGKPYGVYIRQCVDRDASASAYQQRRDDYYRRDYYRR